MTFHLESLSRDLAHEGELEMVKNGGRRQL